MTMELIFSAVTLVVTGLLGVITGKTSIPNKYIPIQNLVVGLIAAGVATGFGLFEDFATAVVVALGMAFAAGGVYDLSKTKIKG